MVSAQQESASVELEKQAIDASEKVGPATPTTATQEKRAWADDVQDIPKNNLPLVFFSLLLATFLAALDQTIVATALPTIVAELKGGQNYSWVGSAYLLASAALSSFYGKFSDLVGRKLVLYPVIVIFLVGSALCGAAQSMTWLILARALQGIGGGGIFQMVNIVVGDIVPLEKRATFGGYSGALWGIASIIGPLVGGAFTDHVSWRWCFFVNLPTGGVALACLFFTLHLNPPQHRKSVRAHVAEFDFLGLALIVGGVVCVLIGFNQSEQSWRSPATIALLAVGCALLLAAAVWEGVTTRSPIIPPRLFRTRTTAILLVTVFIHGFAFFGASYYLPVYYQVLGASATRAGIEILPYSLATCAISLVVGFLISATGAVRPVLWGSYIFMTLGFGLMIMLDEASSLARQVIFTFLAGLGTGGLFFPPIILMQAAMPVRDMATSTATLGLLRQLGSTVGVAVGQTIWSTALRKKLALIPGAAVDTSSANLADSIRQINALEPLALRRAVQHAYTKSVALIWIVDTPLVGLCMVLVLFLKHYTLKRKARPAQDVEDRAADGATERKDADPAALEELPSSAPTIIEESRDSSEKAFVRDTDAA
ncbi:MFS general substrate transporter [Phanerochaete sordida]|uniref:MFS general substrate transporter n=1 Tax=Phanerochaete sordida TaxID=48140 RepID=A0A9P3GCJ2_9APHY|nr:MFS general substrate transporter [Phanerochaete sordida]